MLEDRILLAILTVNPGGSIQAAINTAMPGDTVDVNPGTYTEQLTINKPLTLIGVGGASATTIKSPGTLAFDPTTNSQSIVTITNAATVNMSGFTVTGPTASVIPTDIGIDFGILVANNADLNLSATTVTAIHGALGITGQQTNPITGGPVGIAIGVGNFTAGAATINDVTINDYNRTGIRVNFADSTADITNSTITGVGPTTANGQNGIQIGPGTTATITGNTVTGNEFIGDASSSGIITLGNSTIAGNTIEDNNLGIFTGLNASAEATISGNIVMGNDVGIWIDSGIATVENNTIEGNVAGVLVDPFSGSPVLARLISNNIILNGDGIDVANDSGATMVLLAFFNRIVGNMVGLNNETGDLVSVPDNWWGSNTGPGGLGSDTVEGGPVDFGPWLVLNVTISPQILPQDGVATVVANLTTNSDGIDTSAFGHVPDGIPVIFFTAFGSITPIETATVSGKAIATFVAADISVIATVFARVDNQTSFANTLIVPPSTLEPGETPGSVDEAIEGGVINPASEISKRSFLSSGPFVDPSPASVNALDLIMMGSQRLAGLLFANALRGFPMSNLPT